MSVSLVLAIQKSALLICLGMYALSTHSLEERIAADVILGRLSDAERPVGILAVIDATHLYQGSLFSATTVGARPAGNGRAIDD